MSSSSESGDVPMVDAEEHLATSHINGNRDADVTMKNVGGSEEQSKTSDGPPSQASDTRKPASARESSVNQLLSRISDKPSSRQSTTPSKPTAAKMSDEAFSVKPIGSAVFKNGSDSLMVNGDRSQSTNSQDNDTKKNATLNGHSKNDGTHSRSKSESVLPSVERGENEAHSASPHKYKTAPPPAEEHLATEAELNRLTEDTGLLRDALGKVSHKAAQVILRENWRTFLFDPPDETHVAFILRAGLKNSSPAILNRVVKDDNVFKPPFVEASSQKPALRKKVLESVTMDELLNDIPRKMLDEIVALRILNAPVKELVGWLSQGKRLGYQDDDLISEQDEVVLPNIPPPTQYRQPTYPEFRQPYIHHQNIPSGNAMVTQPGPQQLDPLLVEQNRQRELALQRVAAQRASLATPQLPLPPGPMPPNQTVPLMCNDCGHIFTNFPGYHHHITKKPCTKEPPPGGFKWSCPNCLQGFTTKQGNDYHRLKGVCTATDIVPSTGPTPSIPSNDGLPRTSGPVPYVPPPVQGHPQSPWVSQQQEQSFTSPQPHPQQTMRPPPTATPLPPPPPQRPMTSIEISIPSPTAKRIPPMPPMHTPSSTIPSFVSSTAPPTTRKQAPRKDVRVDPSDLPPERLAAMNLDLTELDRKYEEGVADIPAEWDEETRAQRIISLRNANSSRKSQVRKNYGVTLRMRDKDKQHRNSKRASMHMNAGNDSSSPAGSATTTPVPMAAPTPMVARPNFTGLRMSNGNSPLAGTPSGAGFSPVNVPAVGFSPVNAPRSSLNPSPYGTPTSGFGVLTTKQPSFGSAWNAENEKKRRHEGIEHERRPGSGAGGYTGGVPASGVNGNGVTMVEMESEDAAARYRKSEKVKVHVAGAQVDAHAATGSETPASRASASASSTVVVLDDSDNDKEENGKENGKGKGSEKEGVSED